MCGVKGNNKHKLIKEIKMWFTETKLIELCNDLGIEVVEKEDYPLLNDIELTPDLAVKYFTETETFMEVIK